MPMVRLGFLCRGDDGHLGVILNAKEKYLRLPLASAFGDTDGEFFNQNVFRPKDFTAERGVDDSRRRSFLF